MNKVYLIIQTESTPFSHTVTPLWAYENEYEALDFVTNTYEHLDPKRNITHNFIEIEVKESNGSN